MRGHDRFEALAGAVMLGEADASERAEFDAHASACDACRADAGYGLATTSSIARACDAETWRPSIAEPVRERMASGRTKRHRRTLGAFGWAIALSLVANVAFASGVTGSWTTPFHESGEGAATVATQTISLDRARVASIAPPARARTIVASAPRHERGARRRAFAHVALAPKRTQHAPVATDNATVADGNEFEAATLVREAEREPDLLAGLDIERSNAATAARRVAVEALGCEGERAIERDACTAAIPAPLAR